MGESGTHSSRTMMYEEIETLLRVTKMGVDLEEFSRQILEENCLGKKTMANRKHSLQKLRELYGLDPAIPLFRIMRRLWGQSTESNRLIALLMSLARDPLLRITVESVIHTTPGEEFLRKKMKDSLFDVLGDSMKETTIEKVVRNASASWTQSGHLIGRTRKFRQTVRPTPSACTFALILGYLMGKRGRSLFESPWTAVLDSSSDELIDMAFEAKRIGLLELKQSGAFIDVSFPKLVLDIDRELIHGTN